MSILNKSEKIRIESVKQLEQVYEVLKEEWDKDYTVYEEIDIFNCNELMRYVYWYNDKVALFQKNDGYETITFGQFMSRIPTTPEHPVSKLLHRIYDVTPTEEDLNKILSVADEIAQKTIIESTDGKKYEVIMIREVEEPLNFWKWAEQNGPGRMSNEMVEDYVQYRFNLGL